MPIGLEPIDATSPVSYKIIKDPYKKRISLERYHNGSFEKVIYDSALFDFRKLLAPEQKVWQQSGAGLIRDEDDRVILQEQYTFENSLCRIVTLHSPHGVVFACQKMYYTKLGDPFDGAILYDPEETPIFWKKYALEEQTNEWSHVTDQGWGALISQPH